MQDCSHATVNASNSTSSKLMGKEAAVLTSLGLVFSPKFFGWNLDGPWWLIAIAITVVVVLDHFEIL